MKITQNQIEKSKMEIDNMTIFNYQDSLEMGYYESIESFMLEQIHIDYDKNPHYLAIEQLLKATMKLMEGSEGKWELKDILD